MLLRPDKATSLKLPYVDVSPTGTGRASCKNTPTLSVLIGLIGTSVPPKYYLTHE